MPAKVWVRDSTDNPLRGGWTNESCFDIMVGGDPTEDPTGGTALLRVSAMGVSMPHSNFVIGPDLLWLLSKAETLSRRISIGACKTAAQAQLHLHSSEAGQWLDH